MTRALLQFAWLMTDPLDPAGVLRDGAVLIEGATILATGPAAALRQAYPQAPVQDHGDAIAMPGLVNAHDHGRGLSPLAMGLRDDLLEPWILSLMGLPVVDVAADTALSALAQMHSGITTTTNSYYDPALCPDRLAGVRDAYARVGIGAQVIFSAMDRPATTGLLRAALPGLDAGLAARVTAHLAARAPFDQDRYADVLTAAARQTHPVGMMGGVVSAHWSSDAQMQATAALTRALDIGAQMHLLESPHQARTANAAHPGGIVAHMARLGVLDARLSCAHAVHLSRSDIAALATAGVSVVHNASSNLRLRSGTAQVRALLAGGVNVGLGLDSMGLNDTADMFQELRLVHRLHDALPARQVLAMATAGGARALGLDAQTGTLAPGKQADILVLDAGAMIAPGLSTAQDLPERILHYASPAAVSAVLVAGRRVMTRGRHAHLSEPALRDQVLASLTPADPDRATLAQALVPVLRAQVAPTG